MRPSLGSPRKILARSGEAKMCRRALLHGDGNGDLVLRRKASKGCPVPESENEETHLTLRPSWE